MIDSTGGSLITSMLKNLKDRSICAACEIVQPSSYQMLREASPCSLRIVPNTIMRVSSVPVRLRNVLLSEPAPVIFLDAPSTRGVLRSTLLFFPVFPWRRKCLAGYVQA
jgi:hypothetical protein